MPHKPRVGGSIPPTATNSRSRRHLARSIALPAAHGGARSACAARRRRRRYDAGVVTDEQARIRSYLQAQAAKLTPAAIIDKVRVAMADLRSAADAVPVARFDERPEPQEWSAGEVMAHVVEAGRHFGGAIVAVLDGGTPPESSRARGEASSPSEAPRRSVAEWFALLERDRGALFERVAKADPGAAPG